MEERGNSSFRRKPESGIFNLFKSRWTPVCTGVTTYYAIIISSHMLKALFSSLMFSILFGMLALFPHHAPAMPDYARRTALECVIALWR